ncbi:MAG: hypothetical protein CSB44_09865 [Gammaproteobacteria bacterium]|nr:MAG: hypothetical protein CSB44_09865 [Gammaproteobacteria bacterium]
MANRSYLYSTDNLPESEEWTKKRILRSLSETNYDIPLVFKLLLSGNPIAVKSTIWEYDGKIAIAGEYESGLKNLEDYLSRLPAEAEQLVTEAMTFLSDKANRRKYFILECGEIFNMTEGDLEEKNLALLEEIKELKNNIHAIDVPTLLESKDVSDQNAPQTDFAKQLHRIGLGYWANILYYQFDDI